jgi:hypothetical protein
MVGGAGRHFSVCFDTMPANSKSSSPSLGQYMLRRVLLVAGGASLLFGLLFLALYRDQLQRERAATSEQINRLLRVALENAMLKRDVPGLHEIVERMGKLPGISDVMILAPSGEVRFASRPESLGKQLPRLIRFDRPGVSESRFVAEPGGGRYCARSTRCIHRSRPPEEGLDRRGGGKHAIP